MRSLTDDATVVVFGGAGFIGSHLCRRLIERGCRVIAVDNLSTGRAENVADQSGSGRFRLLGHDVASLHGFPAAVIYEHVADYSIDAVFHLASPASPVDYQRNPVATMRCGSIGTANGLELAQRAQAVFVLASTSEIYGDPEVTPQPETYWGRVNPIGPRSMYDEAKRYAEALTYVYDRQARVDVRVARIFNTYGPGMRLDDGRAVPAFMQAALTGRAMPIHGDGRQTRSLCFVDDLVAGLIMLAESDESRPVNLGNDDEVTVLELAEMIGEIVGGNYGVEWLPRPIDDPQRRRPDLFRARRLGWSPTTTLRDGLAESVGWFRLAVEAVGDRLDAR